MEFLFKFLNGSGLKLMATDDLRVASLRLSLACLRLLLTLRALATATLGSSYDEAEEAGSEVTRVCTSGGGERVEGGLEVTSRLWSR